MQIEYATCTISNYVKMQWAIFINMLNLYFSCFSVICISLPNQSTNSSVSASGVGSIRGSTTSRCRLKLLICHSARLSTIKTKYQHDDEIHLYIQMPMSYILYNQLKTKFLAVYI